MSDLPPALLPRREMQEGQLVNRLRDLAPLLREAGSRNAGAYGQLQTQRLARGQSPWTLPESVRAIQAARTGQAVTPAPERSPFSPGAFFSNLRQDLGAVLSTIPRLPNAIVQEVRSLPQLPQAINQATASGSPGEMIAGIAEAPGVRFLPGSFIVSNLARGEGEELAEHPLMTALDALPAAGRLAGATRVGQAERLAAQSAGRIPRPIKAVATRTLDNAGNLTPNVVGRGVESFLTNTRAGRMGREAFGQEARALMRSKAFSEQGVVEAFDRRAPDPTDPLATQARRLSNLHDQYSSVIPEDRMAAITTDLQTRGVDFVRSNADPSELSFIDEVLDVTRRLEDIKLSDELLIQFRGESYPLEQGRPLIRAEERLNAARKELADEVVPRLETINATAQDSRIATIIDAIRRNDLRVANTEFKNLYVRRTAIQSPSKVGASLGPVSNIRLDTLKNLRLAVGKAYQLERSLTRNAAHAVPARYIPLVDERLLASMDDFYRNKYDQMANSGAITVSQSAEMTDQLVDALARRDFADIPEFSNAEFNTMVREAKESWEAIRSQVPDAIYVHHAPRSKMIHEINFPRIRTAEVTPGSVKQRQVGAFSPSVDNISIALTHEATEMLLSRATTEFLDTVESTWGKTFDQVRSELEGAARIRWERDPSRPYLEYLKDMVNERYVTFNRDTLFHNFGTKPPTATQGVNRAQELYIARPVAANLDRLKPYNAKSFGAVLDPTLNVFRTSVLPLSPRWHVNNIVGGAIMLGATTNPLTVWRHLGDAINIIRSDRGAIPVELRRVLGTANRDVIELNYMGGRTLRRLWDQAQEHFAKNGREGTANAIQGVRNAGSRIVQGSFDANAFVDDMYRTMAYLYGKDKASRGGLSAKAAESAGLNLARRTLQAWDEITPLERTILRSIFPFYGFTQHILRFTGKYPFDHPVRTAILSNIARAELEDLGTGLPQAFLEIIPFGKRDEKGNQLAISTRGLSPFTDVADYFTLSGWVGNVNPAISTLLQQAGIDKLSGQAELFPNLRYDGSTGQLTVGTPNFLGNFATNIIPQSRVLGAMMGWNNEYRELAQSNPDSARRLIQSQLGLPVNLRTFNEPQELMRQEVRRFQDQERAFSAGLTSGDWDYASEFPALQARIQQLRQLQSSGALAAITPDAPAAPLAQLLSLQPIRE